MTQKASRLLAVVALAATLSLLVPFSMPRAGPLANPFSLPRAAYADVPAAQCADAPWQDGRRIVNTEGLWECRCTVSSITGKLLCYWRLVLGTAKRALANGLFVSAELNYTGGWYAMLRGRAQDILGWEQYTYGDAG